MQSSRVLIGVFAVLAIAGCSAQQTAGHQAAGHQTSGQHTSPAGTVSEQPPIGTVSGKFLREGGPLGPGGSEPANVPLSGTVTFSAGRHQVLSVRVGASGLFTVTLPPGRYAVSGRSPSVAEVSNGATIGADGTVSGGTQTDPPCSAPLTATVSAQHITKITLVCPVP